MTAVVTHTTVATLPDQAGVEINKAEWNADHAITGVASPAQGGTGIAYFAVAGPTVERIYTFPDAAATILTTNAAVTVAQGGTGIAVGTSGGVPYFNATTTMASSGILTAGRVVLGGGAGAAPNDSANLIYSAVSGPKFQVGTGSGTSQGWILGNLGGSGVSYLWETSVTPSSSNFAIYANGGELALNLGATNDTMYFTVANSEKMRMFGGAGSGLGITAGTATTDVAALSATQTWNASGVTFTAEKTNVTNTASAIGSLLRDWQVGGNSKFAIGKRGNTISTASANNRAEAKPILYGATTDAATAVELTTDGAAGSGATNRIVVPADTTLSCVVNVAVKQSASASAKQMLRQFVISNNGGTTAIQGTVVTLGTDSGTAGLATVTCTITANDTDDCVKIEVNGIIATNLRYTAYVVSTEVLYA